MKYMISLISAVLVSLNVQAADNLTMAAAVQLAEKFVAENGYTDLPGTHVKEQLDNESIERTPDRQQRLLFRFDSLKPKAVGARPESRGKAGWSIAFEKVRCQENMGYRIVTMQPDGSGARVEHKDAERAYFAGFKAN